MLTYSCLLPYRLRACIIYNEVIEMNTLCEFAKYIVFSK
jgi:hypothetical protein